MHGDDVVEFLERAAPQLIELGIYSNLDLVLSANAPHLEHVKGYADQALEDFFEPVQSHGIPRTWKTLIVMGHDAHLDEAREFFEAHAAQFTDLELFEMRDYSFHDTLGGEPLSDEEVMPVLAPLCPGLALTSS